MEQQGTSTPGGNTASDPARNPAPVSPDQAHDSHKEAPRTRDARLPMTPREPEDVAAEVDQEGREQPRPS